MNESNKVVIATGNAGKLKEIAAILKEFQLKAIAQSSLGVRDADETGTTFVENAIIKARNAASVTRLAAIADDSGLEVDALNGAPGVYSARYAGAQADDADNIRKLLAALEQTNTPHRSARFRCVMVYLRHVTDPSPVIAEGTWEGHILSAPSGNNGFGYDPIFQGQDQSVSTAALDNAIKNRVSHRAKALRTLAEQFSILGLIKG